MSKPEHITFDEFAANLSAVFERVVCDQETVVVERNGVAAEFRPAEAAGPRQRQAKSQADGEAFLSSAGGWKGLVDTEKLKADIYASRRISTRPPVEL